MPKGKRITKLRTLPTLANRRKSVLCPSRWGEKSVPAAVVQHFPLVLAMAMMKDGMWEYKKYGSLEVGKGKLKIEWVGQPGQRKKK